MRALLALTLLLASPAHAQDTSASDDVRPNVVILLADDLGVGDLGCYGQARIRTPHIDAIAAEGVRMEHAYSAAPVCAPSRCALMTGMHTGHCSVDHNDEPNLPVGLADPTIAEVLRREGYRTGLVGKWGLGGETDDGEAFGTFSMPSAMGFEHVLAVLDQARAQDHYPERVLAGEAWRMVPGNVDGAPHVFDDDLFVEDALAFVNESAHDARPFFLYFASTLPHRELTPPAVGHAEDDWPDAERAYATLVERFDADVGRIVEATDALSRDTIVIVASDNGPVSVDGHVTGFFGSAMGLRGQKRDLYEGGLRVPLVVRWRGHLAPRTASAPVALYDLFPTIGDLVGVPVPAGMDGVAIAPWLRGERTDDAHARLFFSAREAHGGSEAATRFMLREGPLVLIERADDARELYDVVADPAQSEDLAATRSDDVARLHAAVIDEASGPIVRAFPVLEVRDEGGREVLPRAAAVECLQALDLGSTLETRAPIDLAITGHGTRIEDDVIALPAGGYVSVGAHPAVSFGEASFTVIARVRLDHLASDARTREARRYLALSKPTGAPDEWLDYAILVQAGDLATHDGASGHELAMVFADPDVGGHGTWTLVARTLAITDAAFHDVAFQYDAPARTVHVVLDGERETIAIDHEWGHVRSDGPLVIGAHHDVHGTFDGFLDGAITRLEIDRGIADTSTGCVAAPRSAAIDLGAIPLGSDRMQRLTMSNAASAPAMGLDVRAELASSDDERVSLDAASASVLTPDATPIPLVLRVRTDAPGSIHATLRILPSLSHVGALEQPIAIEITGEVVAPSTSSEDTLPTWFPFVAAAFIVLGTALVLAGRKSDAKR